ncbi:hypothetical protein V8E36_009246 [Tilletia maclaganii]
MAPSLASSLFLQPRAAGDVLSSWPPQAMDAFAALVDPQGAFNGSCHGPSVLESVPSGTCAAGYNDVTIYCCGAVGGRIKGIHSSNATTTATASSSSSSSTGDDDDNDDDEPHLYCATTLYRTMLMCYDDLVHNSCNLSISPTGICKSNSTDTSTLTGSASSPHRRRRRRRSNGRDGNRIADSLHSLALGSPAQWTLWALVASSVLVASL